MLFQAKAKSRFSRFPAKKYFITLIPDLQVSWASGSVTRLGDLLQLSKPVAKIILAKSLTFLGNLCKGVKICHFSSEIIFGQLL